MSPTTSRPIRILAAAALFAVLAGPRPAGAQTPWKRGAAGPGPRMGHSLLFDAKARRAILFGGKADRRSFADLWGYSPDDDRWTPIETEGAGPEARGLHGAALDPKERRLWIHGGSAKAMLEDLWAFDLDRRTWARLEVRGRGPGPRALVHLHFDPKSRELIALGGMRSLEPQQVCPEIWHYDLADKTWTREAAMPDERLGFATAFDARKRQVLIWGGANTKDPSVWVYDLEKKSLSRRSDGPRITRSPASPTAAFDAKGRRWYLLSGADGEKAIDEAWLYALDPPGAAPMAASVPTPGSFGAACFADGLLLLHGGTAGGFNARTHDDGIWILDPAAKAR